jgi:hypothetical protein
LDSSVAVCQLKTVDGYFPLLLLGIVNFLGCVVQGFDEVSQLGNVASPDDFLLYFSLPLKTRF